MERFQAYLNQSVTLSHLHERLPNFFLRVAGSVFDMLVDAAQDVSTGSVLHHNT